MLEKTNERVIYLDLLRIIAIFAVVILHVSADKWDDAFAQNMSNWYVLNAYDGLVRWSVPIFVMISGALFLSPEKSLDLKKLYSKNILRIVIAFLLWSAIYAVAFYFIDEYSIKTLITSFVGGWYHLWYLLLVVALYAVTPVLRQITKDDKLMKYFMILIFVFAFVSSALIDVLKVIDHFYFADETKTLVYVVNRNLDRADLGLAAGFSLYYVLGYYLSKHEISKKLEISSYVLAVLSVIASIILNAYMAQYKNAVTTYFFDNIKVFVLFEAIAVFIFAKCRLSKIKFSEKVKNIIVKLGKYSFGVYLVHAGVLVFFSRNFFTPISYNPIIAVPAIAIIVFVISYVISIVLNHIPKLNKWIV